MIDYNLPYTNSLFANLLHIAHLWETISQEVFFHKKIAYFLSILFSSDVDKVQVKVEVEVVSRSRCGTESAVSVNVAVAIAGGSFESFCFVSGMPYVPRV